MSRTMFPTWPRWVDLPLRHAVGEMTGICALRTALRDALRTHQTAILDALGWESGRSSVGEEGPRSAQCRRPPSPTLPTRGEETRRTDPCVDSRADGSSCGLPVAKTQAAARVDPASATAPQHPASIS